MKEVSPLIISHNGKEIPVSSDPKVMAFTKKFLLENSPDLSQYFLKPWTEEEYVKIAEFIKAIVPYKQIIDTLVTELKDEKMKKLFTSSKPITKRTAPAGEDLEFKPAPAPQAKSQPISVELEEPEGSSDEDDDLGEIKEKPAPTPTGKGKANQKTSDLDDLLADM
jgi:hypothetical protein